MTRHVDLTPSPTTSRFRLHMPLVLTLIVAFLPVATPSAAQLPAAEITVLKPAASVKLDVVLSRWQGEKKVSSLPFALYIVAPAITQTAGRDVNRPSGNQSVRMGVDVPIGSSTRVANAQGNTGSTTTNSPEYRNVGTSIDGRVSQTDDSRFSVFISVQDTSVFTNDGPATTQLRLADPMAFRTFTMNNTLTMRDGQTLPFAMASDKISGDVIKVDVTVTVLK